MILDGTLLAKKISATLTRKVRILREKGVVPKLAILMVGDNPASLLYTTLKEKKANDLGMACTRIIFPHGTDPREVRHAIEVLNHDTSVHGIILQLPLPGLCADAGLENVILPEKDIDCLGAVNFSQLAKGHKPAGGPPPTSESVVRLISTAGVSLKGLSMVIIGAGFFGRQAAFHCLNLGATVTLADINTKDLSKLTRGAEVVVSAVGKANVVTKDMIRTGSVVIDAGISRVGGVTVGDVSFPEVSRRASWITPVPGGVGPLTVVLLMENVVRAAQKAA